MRFEDLCLNVVYRHRRWFDIQHYGRAGGDRGVDISAVEEFENGSRRNWHIQCKRYRTITKTELARVVDEVCGGSNPLPDVLVLITACNISRAKDEHFKARASLKGIGAAQVWPASVLEARLYAHPDLLFAYFGVNLTAERRDRIATLRRNLQMKTRMLKDFVRGDYDPGKARSDPPSMLLFDEIIVRSVDDEQYPDFDTESLGPSTWMKCVPFGFYYNGLEIAVGVNEAVLTSNGHWSLVEGREDKRRDGCKTARVVALGRIPYANIVDYDLMGDEENDMPHLFCEFRNSGWPYECIVYKTAPRDGDDAICYELDRKLRKGFPKG